MEYKKTQHTLPSDVVQAFEGLDTESRNAYAYALRRARWTLESIAQASGLTRERVRQVVAEFDKTGDKEALVAGRVPSPPVKAQRVTRQFVEPDPAKLARMLELQLSAQSVRGKGVAGRSEAEEFNRLLAHLHLVDGVPLYRLSLRLSENPSAYGKSSSTALRGRLVRYGYMTPAGGGTSKIYAPVLAENRAVH